MGKLVLLQWIIAITCISLIVGINGDEMDDWVEQMGKTSSPADSQPADFNPNSKSTQGRGTLELRGHFKTGSAASSGTTKTIVVAKDGSGQFKTVKDAVKSISKNNNERVIVYIKAGIYKEKITVDADWVTFQGDGAGLTEIRYGDTAEIAGSTFKSASVAVNGDHFTAKDISFRNTAPPPPGGAVGKQAVALRISGDYAAFLNVNFYGAQDTLYDHKGRHYFYNCFIEGSIDFIFGNGRSFYYKCRLHSIANPSGSLTAQKRESTSENTGFSFVDCVVTGSGSIYLGRAWGPASRVVYARTYFDDIIRPEGWFDWGDSSRQKTVFYAEYKCSGPGANRNGRVSWSKVLTDSQAKPFLTTGFINGEQWLNTV